MSHFTHTKFAPDGKTYLWDGWNWIEVFKKDDARQIQSRASFFYSKGSPQWQPEPDRYYHVGMQGEVVENGDVPEGKVVILI